MGLTLVQARQINTTIKQNSRKVSKANISAGVVQKPFHFRYTLKGKMSRSSMEPYGEEILPVPKAY